MRTDAASSAPRENLLSEFFAMTLNYDPNAMSQWLQYLTGEAHDFTEFRVTTRATISDDEGLCYPDLIISQSGNDELLIYQEHKWHAPPDSAQLRRYRRELERSNARIKVLVFVGQSKHFNDADKCLTWYDVEEVIAKCESGISQEFVAFLRTEIGPCSLRPIDSELLKAPKNNDYWPTLQRYFDEVSWSRLPSQLSSHVTTARRESGDYIFHRLKASKHFNWVEGRRREPWVEVGFADGRFPRNEGQGFGSPELSLAVHIGAGRDYDSKTLARLLEQQCRAIGDSDLGVSSFETLQKLEGRATDHRCLILYKSLSAILQDAKSFSDQKAKIDEALGEWFGALFSGPALDWLEKNTKTFTSPHA